MSKMYNVHCTGFDSDVQRTGFDSDVQCTGFDSPDNFFVSKVHEEESPCCTERHYPISSQSKVQYVYIKVRKDLRANNNNINNKCS